MKKYTCGILEHIRKNLKDYILLMLFLLIGIVIGIFCVNHTSIEQQNEINNYITDYINSTKKTEYINYGKLLTDSIFKHLLFAAILWFIGITVTLYPLIYIIFVFRGFCLGYTISSLIAVLGIKDGLLLASTSLLVQNVLFIPVMLAIALSSIKFHSQIISNRETETNRRLKHNKNIKINILKHSIFSMIMIVPIILSSLAETYISMNLANLLIKNI